MDTRTVSGEVSWLSDFGPDNKKSVNNKDTWLRLEQGNNVIRLVTPAFQYIVHKGIKAEGDKGFGQKVSCSIKHGSCALCEMDNKAGLRWLIGVIDRKTSSYRILDMSYQVFSQIKKLAQEAEVWGDPTKYDLNIIVDPNGGPTGYYSVQPRPHKPLSAEDQQLRDTADLEDLTRRTSPPEPSFVQKRVDKLLDGKALAVAVPQPGKAPAKTSAPASKPSAKKAAPVVEVETTDDEETDDVFPAYNK